MPSLGLGSLGISGRLPAPLRAGTKRRIRGGKPGSTVHGQRQFSSAPRRWGRAALVTRPKLWGSDSEQALSEGTPSVPWSYFCSTGSYKRRLRTSTLGSKMPMQHILLKCGAVGPVGGQPLLPQTLALCQNKLRSIVINLMQSSRKLASSFVL